MIGAQRVLGLVPARGGSRRIERKNLATVGGRPLLFWTAIEAQRVERLDHLVLTTDDPEIRAVGCEQGLATPFERPRELATDEASSMDAVLHALDQLEGSADLYQWIAVLQPTSPLRLAEDIDAAIDCCLRWDAPACITVTKGVTKPDRTFHLNADGLAPLLRHATDDRNSRDHLETVEPNGAVYFARVDWLRSEGSFYSTETVGHVMPADRSVDIDVLEDLRRADRLLRERIAPADRS